MNHQSGVLIVLTGPSGVGKGSLKAVLLSQLPWLKESISATTRSMRPGEQDGVDYFFKTHDAFKTMIAAGELLEWAEFSGNFYGTPKAFVQQALAQGQSLLLEIDVQGAIQIRQLFPEAHLIFIEPPSLQTLKERLLKRNTNSEADMQQRLAVAQSELEKKAFFDYCIVNDDFDQCAHSLTALIQSLSPQQSCTS